MWWMTMKPTKSLFTILILQLIALLLASCASAAVTPVVTEARVMTNPKIPTGTPFPTNTQVPTQTPTDIPSSTPTLTPTPIPAALQGTSFTLPEDIISSENANQVTQLARWGNGVAHDVQYSPDGKYIVVSSTIGLYLFDAETHNLIKTFDAYSKGPEIVVFLQDGKSLALQSNGYVEIISFPDGELLEKFKERAAYVWFSQNGEFVAIASCSSPKVVEKVVLQREYRNDKFPPHPNIYHLPGTKKCLHNLISIYALEDHQLINTIELANLPQDVIISPDGTLLILNLKGQFELWRIKDKTQLLEYFFGGQFNLPIDIAFSPDSSLFSFITGSQVRLYSAENGTLVNEIYPKNHSLLLNCIEFSPDGRFLAIGSDRLFLWNIDSGDSVEVFEDEDLILRGNITELSWSSSGDTIITSSSGKYTESLYSTTIWDVDSLKPLEHLEGFDSQIGKVIWHPDSRSITRNIATGWGGYVQILNTVDGEIVQEQGITIGERLRGLIFIESQLLPYLEDFIDESHFQLLPSTLNNDKYTLIYGPEPIALSPDGFYLAWLKNERYSIDDSVHIDFLTRMDKPGSLKHWIVAEQSYWSFIMDLKFDQQSYYLYSIYRGYVTKLNIYDGSAQRIAEFTNPYWNSISDFDIAPDGNTFITAHRNGTFRIFRDGEEILILDEIVGKEKTSRGFPVVDWSPEGSIIALSGFDGTILLIRPTDGEVLHTLEGHTLTVTALVFSPDGKMLVSVSEDGTTRIWGIAP